MKIPKRLKIGAHTITVKQVAEINNGRSDGQYDSGKNHILLLSSLPQSQKEATLIHEIIHALNISLNDELVEFLSQGMYQVLVDNHLLS